MATEITLDIVTPAKKVLSSSCIDVYVPGAKGETGLLTDHSNLVSTLTTGLVKIHRSEGDITLAVRKGFLEVANDKVTLLADEALTKGELDAKAVETELAEVNEKLIAEEVGIDERELLFETRDWLQVKVQLAAQ